MHRHPEDPIGTFTCYITNPARQGGYGVDKRNFITCPYCERQVYGKLGRHFRLKQHQDLEPNDKEINQIIKIAKGIEDGEVTKENPIPRNRFADCPKTLKFSIKCAQREYLEKLNDEGMEDESMEDEVIEDEKDEEEEVDQKDEEKEVQDKEYPEDESVDHEKLDLEQIS